MNLIEVSLVYLTLFQELTGKREETVKVHEGASLKDLLEILCDKYGEEFRDSLRDHGTGAVYGHNHITLNGHLAHLVNKNLEIKLKNGDRVVVAHAVSGG